ncbi:MAG TPA: hypothetical protein VJB93_02165 [Patescibacteria group bacterium]|nr:hypothetical protein [Patescibacteria group bacterium]
MLSQRKKLFTELAILGLGVGFFSVVIVLPVVQDISHITQEIQNQRRELEILYEKGQFLRILRCHISMFEKELPAIQSLFADPNHQLEFITSLETIAAHNSTTIELSLENMDSAFQNDNTSASGENTVAVPMTIRLHGEPQQIIQTITALETSYPIVSIQDFSLRVAEAQQSSEPGAIATLKAVSFWSTSSYDTTTKTECVSAQ